jgi:predicted ATPase
MNRIVRRRRRGGGLRNRGKMRRPGAKKLSRGPASGKLAASPPTPHEAAMSTTEELNLPRWAATLLAARCARRLLRVLPDLSPEATDDDRITFDRAATLAEQSAEAGRARDDVAGAAGDAEVNATRPGDPFRTAAGLTAAFAARAAQSVAGAADTAYTHATTGAGLARSSVIAREMRRERDRLRFLSDKEEWDDATPVAADRTPEPSLKLVAVHARHLRSIPALTWPKDVAGWNKQIPAVVAVGGANGSGKSTLLDVISDAFLALAAIESPAETVRLLPVFRDVELRLEFEIGSAVVAPGKVRFMVGDAAFTHSSASADFWSIEDSQDGTGAYWRKGELIEIIQKSYATRFQETTFPGVYHLPSEDRRLVVPDVAFKSVGRLSSPPFVPRWRPPQEWAQSLEAVLYSLRWDDLNAKEEGRPDDAHQFRAYAEAFHRFTAGQKSLEYQNGEVVVKIAGGDVTHPIADLSGGEKQVLLLCGELLRHWRPGSLILIDEPELHLNPDWQMKLFAALRFWQHERGGQVIFTTQSPALLAAAGDGAVTL